jgi:hypothetical protein
MTSTAYCVFASSALVVFLVGCLVLGRRDREGDSDADRPGSATGQSVDYSEAEVDRWLAQLAELRRVLRRSCA